MRTNGYRNDISSCNEEGGRAFGWAEGKPIGLGVGGGRSALGRVPRQPHGTGHSPPGVLAMNLGGSPGKTLKRRPLVGEGDLANNVLTDKDCRLISEVETNLNHFHRQWQFEKISKDSLTRFSTLVFQNWV